jgi:hypothetical protein
MAAKAARAGNELRAAGVLMDNSHFTRALETIPRRMS